MNLLEKEDLNECVKDYRNTKNGLTSKKTGVTFEDRSRSWTAHFRYYISLFSPKYSFNSRNGGGIRTGNPYASDVINAL